jgi:hypothetical protein
MEKRILAFPKNESYLPLASSLNDPYTQVVESLMLVPEVGSGGHSL